MAYQPEMNLLRATALAGALAASVIAAHAAGVDKVPVDKALHDALPADYQSKGVTVAVFNDWPPDEFVENGQLKGWSVDMAKAMSERLGVPFKFEGTSFDVIIPGLVSKRYDAGFSSFGVTPERLEALDFVPQRKEGTGYAFLKGKDLKLNSEEDLCGHSIALLTGAWDFQYLTKILALVNHTVSKQGNSCSSRSKPLKIIFFQPHFFFKQHSCRFFRHNPLHLNEGFVIRFS